MSEHHHSTSSLARFSPDGRSDLGQRPDRSPTQNPGAGQGPAGRSFYTSALDNQLQRALDRLKALHEGWAGLTDVIVCGPRAIPELRKLLFFAEPSGIFEPRCRVVSALAALGGYDVLVDYLCSSRENVDPVARAGEDAVRSAAARALGGVNKKGVLPLLIRLARERPSIGVAEALGAFGCPEAIPSLIHCLHEDETRAAAEAALRGIGRRARAALMRLAETKSPDESPSNIRARRASMSLLAEIGIAPWQEESIRRLAWDDSADISAYACIAYLSSGPHRDLGEILARMRQILPQLRGGARAVAQESLAEFSAARGPKAVEREAGPATAQGRPAKPKAQRRLLRLPQLREDVGGCGG